eukprot:m.67205 g.67205  ORF g.67205 m.67205 type:complete len:3953 (+) comp35439_c0_seq1:534-12392(+)
MIGRCFSLICPSTALFGLFILFGALPSQFVQGECSHGERRSIANGDIWKPNVCERCVCNQSIAVCDAIRCLHVICSPGKMLVIEPGECCPRCLDERASCSGNLTYRHGEEWKRGACDKCRCRNGVPACESISCNDVGSCPDGLTLEKLEGECCPKCVASGGACTKDGMTYKSGVMFKPLTSLACTMCRCQDGESRCFVPSCPKLMCSEGEQPLLREGACCPVCAGKSCTDGGDEYEAGDYWTPLSNPCQVCSCQNGEKVCVTQHCLSDDCSFSEVALMKPGQCCAICFPLGKSCLDQRKERMNGEIWKPLPCQFCTCSQGNVSCAEAVCDAPLCSEDEQLTLRESQCCPVCTTKPRKCSHNNRTYQHNEEWYPNVCSVCQCDDGKVTCYKKICQLCPNGHIISNDPGHCCPRCEECDDECLSCSGISTNCTLCRNSKLAERGQCVERCSHGFVADSINETCLECHPKCLTCFGTSNRQCLSCGNGRFFQGSHCVDQCGPGYFVQGNACIACNSTCNGCTGRGHNQCTSCADPLALLRDGTCVSTCGAGYFQDGRNCTVCNSNCSSCGPSDSTCTQCSGDLLQQEGNCVATCDESYYLNARSRSCIQCHKSCRTCRGISELTDCTSCFSGLLQNGQCVGRCSDGYYNDGGGSCRACSHPCSRCDGSGTGRCLACTRGFALDGQRCVEKCGARMYAYDGPIGEVCKKCHRSCELCSGAAAGDCLSCRSGEVLFSGQCSSSCPGGHYATPSSVCAACHASCLNCSGPSSSQCSSCRETVQLRSGTCTIGCGSAQYEDTNGICQDCPVGCSSCVAEGNGSSSCRACLGGASLKGDQCVSDCGVGFFSDEGHCRACDASCSTCSGNGKMDCTGCRLGFELALNGRCLSKCPVGQYPDRLRMCHACHSSCLSCSGASDSHCTACIDPGKVLMYGQCLDECQDGFYTHEGKIRECRECHSSCSKCAAGLETECTSCYSGSVFELGQCKSSCSQGFYNARGVCRACPANCRLCNRLDQCTTCETGLFLLANACVRFCPMKQYANTVRRRCERCPSRCGRCVDGSTCSACVDGTFLRNGRCMTTCGVGFYQNRDQRLCEVNSEAPSLSAGQGVRTTYGGVVFLDVSIIAVSDPDTDASKLSIQVVSPPECGKLVRLTEMGDKVTLRTGDVFSHTDMTDGRIQFVHDVRLDSRCDMVLRVSDRQFTSESKVIKIVAASAYSPTVVVNTGITVEEGKRHKITFKQLKVEDRDDKADSVRITAVSGPHFGRLERFREEVKSFTLSDLERGIIRYVNSGSENSFDLILMQVSDGSNIVNFLFRVNITLKDDEPPRIVVNLRLTVNENAIVAITGLYLKAHDDDTDDRDLVFEITQIPSEGAVVQRADVPSTGVTPGGWTVVSGTGKMQRRVSQFMQSELMAGNIFYEHSGSESKTDSFRFKVSDTNSNVLRNQVFDVKIIPVDDAVPRLASQLSRPLGFSVEEGSVTEITGQELAFTDADSEDLDLVYTVLTPPRVGLLELSRSPNVSASEFTQRDVNSGAVRFRAPNKEIGTAAVKTEFQFKVSDGSNESPMETFTISVRPVNNQRPELDDSSPLTLEEGGKKRISEAQISASDPDTESNALFLTITRLPDNGKLLKREGPAVIRIRVGTDFSLQDVSKGLIEYEHDGSETRRDNFGIAVSDGKFRSVGVVDIVVTSVDSDSPRLKHATKRLNVAEDSFGRINGRVLSATDSDTDDRRLTYTVTKAPTVGWIWVDADEGSFNASTGDQFTQGQVDDNAVYYVTQGEIGPTRRTDSFTVSITDDAGNQHIGVEVAVAVTPVNDKKPKVVSREALVVKEGGSAFLQERNLKVSDEDTVGSAVVCRVTTLPRRGFLENRRRARGLAVNSFTADDLAALSVGYVQNQHRGMEPESDSLEGHCTDGVHTSDLAVRIVIEQVNDERPVISAGTLLCPEDGSVVISNQTLSVTDLDSRDDDLVFTLVRRPSFGDIMKPATGETIREGETFTTSELSGKLIAYQHDGKVTNSDRIEVSVSDGSLEATVTIQVVIGAIDDETPRVTVNTGLELKKGESALILPDNLRATDVDSPDGDLAFFLFLNPSKGVLRLRRSDGFVDLTTSGNNSFLQTDVNAGRLQYRHLHSSGIDLFKFNVEDAAGNTLIDQDFVVNVVEDRIPPRVVTNNGLTVTEGNFAKLSTSELSATDVNSDDSKLFFTVDSAPSYGRLEWVGWPGSKVNNFTQIDLAAEAILYRHESEDESEGDHFRFTVTDGTNNVSMMFYITVSAVDDSLPTLTNQGLRLLEGGRKSITPFELEATDPDTRPERIVFDVSERPKFGRLDRSDVSSFVPVLHRWEILENRISYVHDGTNTEDDFFKFKVSDSTNDKFRVVEGNGKTATTHRPQTFRIKIIQVDDGTPRISVNKGLDFLTSSGKGKDSGRITPRLLKATDDDTDDGLLVFTITKGPYYGHVALCEEAACFSSPPVGQFTQRDLDRGRVFYVKENTTETNDRFAFSVADSKPNTLRDQTFDIRWSYLEFDSSKYSVREEVGNVELTVRRRGNLNKVSYVLCKTVGGTATSSDFVETSVRLQFEVAEQEKTCSVSIVDDGVFEGKEHFRVTLDSPVRSLIGQLSEAKVVIEDLEDEPQMSFVTSIVSVNESVGVVNVLLKRTGDLNVASSVVCYTEDKSASGSLSPLSGSDYVERRVRAAQSRVDFRPGQAKAVCTVTLIDDSLYENAESFLVKLSHAKSGTIGKVNLAVVTILGPNDEPLIQFSKRSYSFKESAGVVSVVVQRNGPDLEHSSRVWCSVHQNDPVSAKRAEDFRAKSAEIIFLPGETSKPFQLEIMDDKANPKLEGNESVGLILSWAESASLKHPARAVLYIDDTDEDMPTMSFAQSEYVVEETNGTLAAIVFRTGDISYESSVRCYTRSGSATAAEDFLGRADVDGFRLRFMPGERAKACEVSIVNDSTSEPDEFFTLALSAAVSTAQGALAAIGRNETRVVIANSEDITTVQFERSVYEVAEPAGLGQVTELRLAVVRSGDARNTSTVDCSTRDGLALSGKDYQPLIRKLIFEPGQRRLEFIVEVLYSQEMEWEETFSVILGPDPPLNAILGEQSTARVQIVDWQARSSIVLPDTPTVVSLLSYDDPIQQPASEPSPGYPVVCVMPCDVHHPNYQSTRRLCELNGRLLANHTNFRWEVAPPPDEDGVRRPFKQLDGDTVFTTTKSAVLDSIYFCPRCLVRCSVQPFDEAGTLGGWYSSEAITIGWRNSICGTRNSRGGGDGLELFKAESFIANLDYVDGRDKVHSNHMKITIQIPHQDGLLPALSTRRIDDLKFTLSESSYRQQHVCSNLLDYREWLGLTSFGFISPFFSAADSAVPRTYPHQFDSAMRGEKTVRLYQHLDLSKCLWTFEAYFHMTELVDICGGTVTTDFGVRDQTTSELSVTVPLHVSYVYTAPGVGWRSLEHSTEMKFSFVYSTILWQSGVSAESSRRGTLQVLKALIRPSDGRFEITFKTDAKFRGKFVISHPAMADERSRVEPPSDVAVSFDLVEMFSESSFDSPAQMWRASSQLSTLDYTGTYAVYLMPCTVKPTDRYEAAAVSSGDALLRCTPYPPVRFNMAISFSQVSQPVPEEYRLGTEFMLHNTLDAYLQDPMAPGVDLSELAYSGAFSKGKTIYGRVLWAPSQDLRRSFKLTIESVFLCSGRDGFLPYYDPRGEQDKGVAQWGCLQPSPKLAHRFKLLDRIEPETEDKHFKQVPFRAEFAAGNPAHRAIVGMPGVDGFSLVTDPLYEVEAGRVWYIQVLYKISSATDAGIGRRSVAGLLVRRGRRATVQDQLKEGSDVEGTNMGFFKVDDAASDTSSTSGVSVGIVAGAAVGGLVTLVATVLAVFAVLYLRQARGSEKEEETEEKESKENKKSVEAKSASAMKVELDDYDEHSDREIDKSIDGISYEESDDYAESCVKVPITDDYDDEHTEV